MKLQSDLRNVVCHFLQHATNHGDKRSEEFRNLENPQNADVPNES